MQKQQRVLFIVVLTPLMIMAFYAGLVERPSWRFSPTIGKERRAAIAIRDAVPPFQQWGTKSFTLPYLERYYARAYYITEREHGKAQDAFIDNLQRALAQHEAVDIFILAHSNSYVRGVKAIAPESRRRIRLVYNTGCYDVEQTQEWLQLGARTYIGHPGFSQSPIFYFFFLRRWTLGGSADLLIKESNALMRSVIDKERLLPMTLVDTEATYESSAARCAGECTLRIGD